MNQGVSWAELSTGVRLAYVSVGPSSATPVLLLHAWGESRRSFDRLMPMLANSVHAVAVDQRGHGDADRPRSGYSLASLAEDIVAFMDASGRREVIGLDVGESETEAFWREFPARGLSDEVCVWSW